MIEHPADASRRGMGRRVFLVSTLRAGAATAATGLVVPAVGRAAPSNRIVLAAIGVGGRGSYDLAAALAEPDTHVVAVCDVRRARRDQAKRMVDAQYGGGDCAAVSDFREILARPDIDAVLLAPGDRWHATMSILAMQAGKDVFCEKPSTMTIEEGERLVAAARRYGRVFQTGTQRLSEETFVLADEIARTGRLGRVVTVYAHTLPFRMRMDWLPAQPEPDRDEFDWDLWLGPAPWRPYNAGYTGGCGAWLDFFDFGAGVAGWCSHTIVQCQAAVGALSQPAVEYCFPGNDDADGFAVRFANGVRLVLRTGGWRGTCGVRYEGAEGWVSVADGYAAPDASSPLLLADRARLLRDYRERTGRTLHHLRDFLDCVRSRRPPIANERVAHASMTICHAINISMLLRRDGRWDAARAVFRGDPEANRMRARAVRPPWLV